METIIASLVEESPEHEILPEAKTYDLRALRVNWTHETTCLEVEVSNHEKYKTLKFSGVENLYIPGGELIHSTLLIIKNTSNCQSSTHKIPPICVGGTSKENHVLRFWAETVEEL